jgi:hypothetical protein
MESYRITMQDQLPDADQIEPLLERGRPPMPRAADRDAWTAVARRPWIAERLPEMRERAERLAAAGPTRVRATDYLDYFRRGVRDAHSASAPGAADVALLTALECLEHEGRFMDALLDLSWALAEETSWIMPPHLRTPTNEPLPDINLPEVDLRVAGVARALAEMCYLLGPQMDAVTPNWRRRIQHELERQAVRPYLERNFWWDTGTNNWNAVCTDGVVAAALLGDFGPRTRARVLAKAVRSVPIFLGGFTADGGCTEGPGYWAYGVGCYSSLCYHVDCATGGALDLLADPVLPAVYAYPTKVILSDSIVANFADSAPRVGYRSGPVAWAAGRLGVREMVALASPQGEGRFRLATVLDVLLAEEPAPFEPPLQSYLPDLMFLITRSEGDPEDRVSLAVKGGHNNEHHNHNDVGNFIIHRRGESLVCDLGGGKYVKEFFGPRRYEFLTTRSCGHNVPLVNGFEQPAGAQYRAEGFGLEEGGGAVGVRMELRDAYPSEADLESLRRRIVLHKTAPGRVELTDTVRFARQPGRYELPLHTSGTFEQGGAGKVIAQGAAGALEIGWDPCLLDAAIERLEHGDEALAHRFGPALSRCTFRLREPSRQAEVRLTFTPRDGRSAAGA